MALGHAITGKCYCGAVSFYSDAEPKVATYCHCEDCRRATGGPVAAFAAFDEGAVVFAPSEGKRVASGAAVRTFCAECGSSLTGRYDYLPGQVYVSIGVIDQADQLAPEVHAHAGERLAWLHIQDDLDRVEATARARLADRSA